MTVGKNEIIINEDSVDNLKASSLARELATGSCYV